MRIVQLLKDIHICHHVGDRDRTDTIYARSLVYVEECDLVSGEVKIKHLPTGIEYWLKPSEYKHIPNWRGE